MSKKKGASLTIPKRLKQFPHILLCILTKKIRDFKDFPCSYLFELFLTKCANTGTVANC